MLLLAELPDSLAKLAISFIDLFDNLLEVSMVFRELQLHRVKRLAHKVGHLKVNQFRLLQLRCSLTNRLTLSLLAADGNSPLLGRLSLSTSALPWGGC